MVVRPRKCRMVEAEPEAAHFKPCGIPLKGKNTVRLRVEGLEALRLADLKGLSQLDAARRMGVSRQTFGRMLCEARQIVAQALVEGMALKVDGGDYSVGQPEAMPDERAKLTSDTEVMKRENAMSKIAISSEGPTLEDMVDPRFGRAGGFVVVDLETSKIEYLDNGASQARAQGAGIQAAEIVAKAGAKVVLSGFVGPQALRALKAAGVQVGQDLEGITVGQALERYKTKQVTMAD
jgi:predicted DNA-binding protein (UPF0251 family)/predicted Fe-Mo cluster-binding NifX family protein